MAATDLPPPPPITPRRVGWSPGRVFAVVSLFTIVGAAVGSVVTWLVIDDQPTDVGAAEPDQPARTSAQPPPTTERPRPAAAPGRPTTTTSTTTSTSTSSTTTTTVPPEPLTTEHFAVELFETGRQCFNTAGGLVDVEPELVYLGPPGLPDGRAFVIVFDIVGGEHTERFNLEVDTDGTYSFWPETISTLGCDDQLHTVVTDVRERT